MTEVLVTNSHITYGMQGFCIYVALLGSASTFLSLQQSACYKPHSIWHSPNRHTNWTRNVCEWRANTTHV